MDNGPFYASKPDITTFLFGDGGEENPGPNLQDKIPKGKQGVAEVGIEEEMGRHALP